MKSAVYQSVDGEEVLEKVFKFLVKQGLENASIREICRGTGIVQGSLYYWFSDKTSIVSEATEYGMKKVTDEIFEYVFTSVKDLPKFFATCLDKMDEYKDDLKFIYQMVASPKYGERIRNGGYDFKKMYGKYAEKLSEQLNYDLDKVRPIVYLMVSAILDYAVWEDRENSQAQLDFIYSILPKVMDNAEK